MRECGFTYRGETLESHGYIICEFDGSASTETVATDSQRSYTSIPMFGGNRRPILFYTYEEALVMKTSICKSDDDDMFITPAEAAALKRWLGSPTPQVLSVEGDEYEPYHWVGVFNIEEVHNAMGCVGFNLTFTSVGPFGYKNTVTATGTVAAGGSVTINDTSDEEGYIYPDITIITRGAGDLTIHNSFDGRDTIIKDCVSGETLTMTNLLQLTSSHGDHSIGKTFNYKFVRICNDYTHNENTLTFSLPCTYQISYKPIAKVVFG